MLFTPKQQSYLFTSESVSEGHPDKICDQISDAIVDAFLTLDPEARTAIETMATTNKIIIAGEYRCKEQLPFSRIEEIARETVRTIGYDQDNFHWDTLSVDILLHEQSADIAQGVDAGDNKEEGAGDQGIMFGYATNETHALMPATLFYAHKILRHISVARHAGQLPQLGPDAKSQVTLEYTNGKPVRATSIVVSTQHKEDISQDEIREIVRGFVVDALPEGWMCDEEHFYVNPTGKFVIGGPDSDVGLTGRKIIVDSYGGAAPHGGGAYSGKDPSKVDRSASYAARYLAKNVVAAGLADQCTIQIAYAIGIAKPLAVYANTYGTGKVDDTDIATWVQDVMDLSPKGIRKHLKLNRPIYFPTASYGHFGRTPTPEGAFSWEQTDLVDVLKKKLNTSTNTIKHKEKAFA